MFDIFSGQGKDPVAKWKLYGGPSAVYKVSFTGELLVLVSLLQFIHIES